MPDTNDTPPHTSDITSGDVPPALVEALGITFRDPALLQHALLHRSFLNEHPERHPGQTSNERLEFLGDAVLNMLTAAWLYQRFPDHSEGNLTALRAALVKTATLARFARELRLGRYMQMSRGETSSGARERPGLLADAFEAVLGALYLDQGIEAARTFVEPFLQREVEQILQQQTDIDSRTRLQELIQARQGITPTYRTIRVAGPDHCREFTVAVLVNEEQIGVGRGSSKQNAAQAAARQALGTFDAQP
jgi:ribonuclease-3